MESYPGVFISSLTDAAWEPHPEFGGERYVLCDGPEVAAGLYRFTKVPEPLRWTIPGRETKLILEGTTRIEIDDGPVLEFKAGDIFSLPAGRSATWHFTAPYKEFWVIAL